MKTAVDSSVLLLILRRQPGWEAWRDALTRAAAEGITVMCPVVFAECSIGFPSQAEAMAQFESLRIDYENFSPESAWLAGQTFLRYRRKGGQRAHLLPDFLVAAHAATQTDRFAALDRGYLRTYFPQLALIEP